MKEKNLNQTQETPQTIIEQKTIIENKFEDVPHGEANILENFPIT